MNALSVDLPTTPRNLSVAVSTVADLTLIVRWAPPSDTGAGNQDVSVLTSYIIEEATIQSDVNLSIVPSLAYLIRSNLSKGYIYEYRITAVNPAGSSQPSIVAAAMAISKPSSPQNLSAVVSGSLRLSFSWLVPKDSGNLGYGTPIHLQQYLLSVLIDASSTLLQTISLSPNSTNYTLTPSTLLLSAGVLYDFRLYAENAAGLSPPAVVSQIPVALPTVPQNFVATVTNPLEITLSWSMPANTGGIGQELPIANYALSVSLFSNLADTTLLYRGGAFIFVHRNLTKAEIYYYIVVAENAAGVGAPAGPVDETGIVLPTAPELTVANTANLQLTATWMPPTDTGKGDQTRPLLFYLLEVDNVAISNGSFQGSPFGTACYAAQEPPCYYTQTPSTEAYRGLSLSMTLTSLIKGMTYYLRVSAINSAGAGPASSRAIRQALVLPSVPRNFSMDIASENGSLILRLYWNVPLETGAGVTSLGQLPPADPSIPGNALEIDYISQVRNTKLQLHNDCDSHLRSMDAIALH